MRERVIFQITIEPKEDTKFLILFAIFADQREFHKVPQSSTTFHNGPDLMSQSSLISESSTKFPNLSCASKSSPKLVELTLELALSSLWVRS